MFWALGGDGGTGDVTGGTRAPAFSLPATDGRTVSLDGLAGSNVLLYFNEGAGCDACFTQMVEIEQSLNRLEDLGVRFVPVMTNPAAPVRAELARFGLTTPVLIDASKEVSRAYDTLGRGHHADLPGHSFILIDREGVIRWRGDYPSMYVGTSELLARISASLRG